MSMSPAPGSGGRHSTQARTLTPSPSAGMLAGPAAAPGRAGRGHSRCAHRCVLPSSHAGPGADVVWGGIRAWCCLWMQAGADRRRLTCRSGRGGVARAGFEPATFHFSGERCYQLSYLADARQLVGTSPVPADEHRSGDTPGGCITALATPTGLEPATSAVTGRRANQLRYGALLGPTCCTLTGCPRNYSPPDRVPRNRPTAVPDRDGRCRAPALKRDRSVRHS